MPTPHIEAAVGDFAPVVLMPGDPLRAAYIAENHLDDARMVTNVRNMSGFTGTWNGKPVSVMASGMGMPSAAIYLTELFREYEVETIVRIGTSGAFQPDLPLRGLVAASTAVTNSAMPELLAGGPIDMAATPSLLDACLTTAAELGLTVQTGAVFTSDIFYEPDDSSQKEHTANGVLCVEMETAALYAIAHLEKRQALSLLTMSDHLVTGERLSSADRQSSLDEMIGLALATTLR